MHISDPRGDPEGGKLLPASQTHNGNMQAWISSCYACHDRTLLPIHLFCYQMPVS